jgi:Uma2 family endonuclease
MAIQRKLMTAEELFKMPDDGMRHELVKGELRTMPPAGAEHGFVAIVAGAQVLNHVKANRLGWVFAAETGFTIERGPDTVRAPDVAFVAAGRFPDGRPPRTFADLAPDLAVEVLSPSDRPREVREKVLQWIEAGVRLVWVISPSARSVTVYRSNGSTRVLSAADQLDGEDVLPGFTCAVQDLLSF